MNRYRVCVHSFVVVQANNEANAKANAELAVRKAVTAAYTSTEDSLANLFADDDGSRMGFLAKGKPVRVRDDQ